MSLISVNLFRWQIFFSAGGRYFSHTFLDHFRWRKTFSAGGRYFSRTFLDLFRWRKTFSAGGRYFSRTFSAGGKPFPLAGVISHVPFLPFPLADICRHQFPPADIGLHTCFKRT